MNKNKENPNIIQLDPNQKKCILNRLQLPSLKLQSLTCRNQNHTPSHRNINLHLNRALKKMPSCQLFRNLAIQRQSLNQTLRVNNSKLDQSVVNFYRLEGKYGRMLDKKIRKKPITVKLSNERMTQKAITKKQILFPQALTEYKVGTHVLNNTCKDSIFSAYRYGASLAAYQKSLYLYGGHPWSSNQAKIHLHKYDLSTSNWEQLPHKGDFPLFSTKSHTCEVFKTHLLFIGGYGGMSIPKKTRFFSKSINAYSLEKHRWQKIDWKIGLRGHASLVYENILLVYGGINENQKYSSQMHYVVLNGNNISNSTSFTFDLKQHSINPSRPLSHHKMVHTFDVDHSLKELIRFNGVFLFGGKYENEKGVIQMDNNLFFFNPKSTDNKFLQNKVKGWESLAVKGAKPSPRYNHSFHVLNKQACCVLLGGVNKEQETLKDVWILDLIYLNWIQATLNQPDNLISQKGLHSQCSAVINSELFIFGGIHQNHQINTLMLKIGDKVQDQNCSLQQLNPKKQYTSKQTLKSFQNSMKAGQRLLSIVIFHDPKE